MEHKKGTRKRLLDAAVSIIDEEGVEGIRIRDIAAAAGVREPSVYHFFGSREGLVEAALTERFTIQQSQLFHAFGEGLLSCRTQAEFLQHVRNVLEESYDDTRAKVRSIRADVVGSAQSRPELKASVNEILFNSFQEFSRYIKDAQIRGWVDPDLDSLAFAAWLAGTSQGRIYIEMNPEAYDMNAWQKMTTDAVLLALGYVDGKPTWQ